MCEQYNVINISCNACISLQVSMVVLKLIRCFDSPIRDGEFKRLLYSRYQEIIFISLQQHYISIEVQDKRLLQKYT